jgi:hypothetical protein
LRTQFDFVLPKGFVDDSGTVHRAGTMRLATARDEIEPLRDRSITDPDDPYLTVLVLARVIERLGSLPAIDHDVVEGLFAADLAFLQDLYGIINFGDPADVEALQATVVDAIEEPADELDSAADNSDASDNAGEADEAVVDAPPKKAAAKKKAGARSRAQIEEVPTPNGS